MGNRDYDCTLSFRISSSFRLFLRSIMIDTSYTRLYGLVIFELPFQNSDLEKFYEICL